MKEIGLILLLWLLHGSYCLFQNGKKLKNTFAILKGLFGMKQCIKECLLQKSCQAVGYHREQLRCELGDSKGVLDVSDQAFATAVRSELSEYQPLLGGCANHNCDVLQRCVARKSGECQCLMPASCNKSAGYTIIHSGEDYVCQKIYVKGVGFVVYDMAENQCQSDGGRLMIMDKMWKIDITARRMTSGGAATKNKFIVNGFKDENGRWMFSDGRKFVQVEHITYTFNSGEDVVMTRDKEFRANPRELPSYGFVCEM